MKRPNLVFILADDLGYADLGCYGARVATTPVLDRLAADGVRFTDGYANSAVCSPTRFALITGRYQYRLRAAAEEPMTGRAKGNPVMGLPPEHPTLPSLLRAAGYSTALIGKWHLGWLPHFGPLRCGYEEFWGLMGGGVDYFRHCDRSGRHDLYEGEQEIFRSGYLTDLLSERAADYVRRQALHGGPFLLSLHYTAPHWPWETRDDEAIAERIAGSIAHTDGGSVNTYYRMIAQMDEGIGAVVDALRATGLLENTLIVFTSDNGGERFSDTWPFVGQKMDLLEGGIRVPLIAHWPAGAACDAHCAQPNLTMDWMPTLLDVAGLVPDPSYPADGVSLRAQLQTPGEVRQRELYWRTLHREQRAMRSGDWKYLAVGPHEYLFDLSQDGRERANLAALYPDRLLDLRERYQRWAGTMPAIPDDARAELVYDERVIPQGGYGRGYGVRLS